MGTRRRPFCPMCEPVQVINAALMQRLDQLTEAFDLLRAQLILNGNVPPLVSTTGPYIDPSVAPLTVGPGVAPLTVGTPLHGCQHIKVQETSRGRYCMDCNTRLGPRPLDVLLAQKIVSDHKATRGPLRYEWLHWDIVNALARAYRRGLRAGKEGR
jgi:hypothetical protein